MDYSCKAMTGLFSYGTNNTNIEENLHQTSIAADVELFTSN